MNNDLEQKEPVTESLVDFCNRIYEHDKISCDSFYHLCIKRPYTYKGLKKHINKYYFPNITIGDVVMNADKWQNYVVTYVHAGSDCSITVGAELNCKTINDLIYYCSDYISKDCLFQEILTNKIYTLDYVKTFSEAFENILYITEVDVDENKIIKRIYYMKK